MGREIALLINCANTRTRVQIPSIPVKGAVQSYTTEVSPLERQTGGSLELGGRVVFPNHRAPGPVRDSVFKIKVKSNSKHLPSVSDLHRNTLACSPLNVCMHALHMQTLTAH